MDARLPDEVKAAVRGKAFKLNQTDHAQGHILPDVPAWLRLGICGLRARRFARRSKPIRIPMRCFTRRPTSRSTPPASSSRAMRDWQASNSEG